MFLVMKSSSPHHGCPRYDTSISINTKQWTMFLLRIMTHSLDVISSRINHKCSCLPVRMTCSRYKRDKLSKGAGCSCSTPGISRLPSVSVYMYKRNSIHQAIGTRGQDSPPRLTIVIRMVVISQPRLTIVLTTRCHRRSIPGINCSSICFSSESAGFSLPLIGILLERGFEPLHRKAW